MHPVFSRHATSVGLLLASLSVLMSGCVYKPVIKEQPRHYDARVPLQALQARAWRSPDVALLSGRRGRSAWPRCSWGGTLHRTRSHRISACDFVANASRCGCGPVHAFACRGAILRTPQTLCEPRIYFKPLVLKPVRPYFAPMGWCHIPPSLKVARAAPRREKPAPRCAPKTLRAPLRSSPVVLERYISAPVPRCGCAIPYRGQPYLTSADMTFITHGYGKLASSGIWVQVVNRTFTSTLVRATNWQHRELQSFNTRYAYAPGSVHTFALPLERSVFGYGFFSTQRDRAHYLEKIPSRDQRRWFKSDCRHLLFQVGIMARGAMLGTTGNTFGFDGRTVWSGYGGNNRWDFTAILTLHFSDGSAIIYERPFVLLDSTNGKLVLTRFR